MEEKKLNILRYEDCDKTNEKVVSLFVSMYLVKSY